MQKFSEQSFTLEYESYFKLSHLSISGNGGFYSSDVSLTPPNIKYTTKKKFEGKVLVWITLGPKGLSQALIRESGSAINSQRYLKECIQHPLIPYIQSNDTEDDYVLWPDQASPHYPKVATDYLHGKNIHFVKKEDNPANVPEIMPIEDFWANLKSQVYNKGWKAENT